MQLKRSGVTRALLKQHFTKCQQTE